MNTILSNIKLTKGAFYHHYPNKTELGYDVTNNIIFDYINNQWIKPLAQHENPINGIQAIVRKLTKEITKEQLENGCPLNNLTQEMSSLDEGFRVRLKSIYDHWRSAVSNSLIKGQAKGYVHRAVNAERVAKFIVAVIQGSIGTTKSSRDIKLISDCGDEIVAYMETLRALPVRNSYQSDEIVASMDALKLLSSRKTGCSSMGINARWYWHRPKRKKQEAVT